MYKNFSDKKIIIVCGHYGSGKTNIAVNLAINDAEFTKHKVSLADVDIVNPYFRAADAISMLSGAGVTPLIPEYANSNVDIPSLPNNLLASITSSDENSVIYIDVGGDDGSVVLGMFSDKIKNSGYEMIYVVNMYRPLTNTPESAIKVMKEIENASRLKCTMISNNSSVGNDTSYDDFISSFEYAEKCSALAGIPLGFHSYYQSLLPHLDEYIKQNNISCGTLFPMKRATKSLF